VSAYVEHYPTAFYRVVDGEPDHSVTVEVFQLRPGDETRLVEWAGGGYVALVNGGPAVLLPGNAGVVGLGDFALRAGEDLWAERADGFSQRYIPVAQD
jgi:hypothetical protein